MSITTFAELPQRNFAVLTPYLIPAGLAKRPNVGDGFILDSACKLIGAAPRFLLSSRAPLHAAVPQINECAFLLVAGANILKDDFELAPGFDLALLASIKVPVILMGIGHYGAAEVTRGLTPLSVHLLEALLARFPAMSVRCEASRNYVLSAMPSRDAEVLMTGCPVAQPVDGIDHGFRHKEVHDRLVVTLTDRSNLAEQLPLLPAARNTFPARSRVLALHQDYGNAALWQYASQQGFEIFRSAQLQPFLELYAGTDVHLGNRVHAHLKCLSLGVRSHCTPFDLRQRFFAESLDSPLVEQLPNTAIQSYDFNRAVARRQAARQTMDRFVGKVKALLESGTDGH